jgi:hypothetical protein
MNLTLEQRLRGMRFGLGGDKIAGIQARNGRPVPAGEAVPAGDQSSLMLRFRRFKAHWQIEGLDRRPDRALITLPFPLSEIVAYLRGNLLNGGAARETRLIETTEADSRIFSLRPVIVVLGAALLILLAAALVSGAGFFWTALLWLLLPMVAAVTFEYAIAVPSIFSKRPEFPIFPSSATITLHERRTITYKEDEAGRVERTAEPAMGALWVQSSVELADERDRLKAYTVRFGGQPVFSSAGFVALAGTPRIEWSDSSGVSTYSPAVVKLADVFGGEDLEAAFSADEHVRAKPIKMRFDFRTTAADDDDTTPLDFVTLVDPEAGSRNLRVTMRNGRSADGGAESFRFRSFEVDLPLRFPPVERVTAEIVGGRQPGEKVQLNMAKYVDRVGFNAESVRDDVWIEPGAQLVFHVRFERNLPLESLGKDCELKGVMRLRHGQTSERGAAEPCCGLTGFQLFDAFGRQTTTTVQSFSDTDLETAVKLSLSLARLRGVEMKTYQKDIECPSDLVPESSLVCAIVDALVDRDFHVRQVREDRGSDAATGTGSVLFWDISARDERTMFSPDVQVVIAGAGARRKSGGAPRVQVSVLGRVRNAADDERLKQTLTTVEGAVAGVLVDHAAQDEIVASSAQVNGTGGPVARVDSAHEDLLLRLEAIVGRLETLARAPRSAL